VKMMNVENNLKSIVNDSSLVEESYVDLNTDLAGEVQIKSVFLETEPKTKLITDFNQKGYSINDAISQGFSTNIKALSFFSGCGGLDIGSHLAGVEVISSMDNDAQCIKTLSANPVFERSQIRLSDITKEKGIDYKKVIKHAKADKIIMIGGPPCQPFSKAGYWQTNDVRLKEKDPRNMIGEYLRLIEEIKPDGFILENVESILHPSNTVAVNYIHERINKLGFNLTLVRANAIEYGVPQKRKRVFFIASKKKFRTNHPRKINGSEEEIKLNPSLIPYEKVIDWIGVFDRPEYHEHEESASGKYYEDLLQVPPGKNYIALTARENYPNPKFIAGKRYWTFLLKLHPAETSWTIISQPGHWEGPFHWKSRRLRIPEVAAIQTFPKDFMFTGSRRMVHKQIGNAVPPLLGKSMVEFLVENL